MKADKYWHQHVYVDSQTGEILNENQVKQHYRITKNTKNVKYIETYKKGLRITIGIIEHTKLCIRKEQLTIW